MCVNYIIEIFCVSNHNYDANCSRKEPHWENECKFTQTFSTLTLRDGLSQLIRAPSILSDGLLPEQGHVSTVVVLMGVLERINWIGCLSK